MADEIYVPWKMAVNALKLEIINLLVNRYGYTHVQAIDKQMQSLAKYDPIIDDIMKKLIAECSYKGLTVILGRNPISYYTVTQYNMHHIN